ncbi:MAG: DUF6456 domain-containing protein [Xanthobacteraceae bacterium]
MLHKVAAGEGARSAPGSPCYSDAELIAADLAERNGDGVVSITAAGRAWIARQNAALRARHLDPYVAQHLSLSARDIDAAEGRRAVVVDDNESPLGWLARRKGRDGQPLLAAHQLSAGERLRAEFTRAQLMPRVTSNWQAAVSQGSRAENSGRANISDTIVAARQRVRQALDAAGPEFSGLLIDVCCFLKGLEDVERERIWPARSAKIVLQLGLDRLARHYGLGEVARGKSQIGLRVWSAPAVSDAADM